MCIAKVIEIFNYRVTSMPRSASEGLEPYDGNLSRTVLRGLGARNGPWLPGVLTSTVFIRYSQYITGMAIKSSGTKC